MSQAKSIDTDYTAYEMRGIMLRARAVAWLVLASYYATLGMAYIFDLSPEARRFYLWIYGVGSITSLIVCIALHISKSLIWRFSLPIVATTPVLAEAAFFQPLNGAVFWWSVFVAGYGAILFLNKEERAAVFALPIIVGLGGGVVLLLHPKIASLPANPISHGVFRYSVLQIAMIVAAIVGLLQYNYTRQRLLNREMQLSDALARQEEANAQLLAEKQLSEQRRQQVEAALVQIEQLREQERLSREREAFLVRYETLMRKGYTLSLEEFADQLLIELSKDITIFGGIFYVRDGQGWVVKASYAFPEKVGTYVSGGTLRTAEVVRQPYLISPAPMATIDIRSGLLRPRPKGVLYLPFYSEVTHEVACIVEVVLAETLKPETLERLETLLPRIGTYWWVRSQPLQKSSIHS